MELEIQKLLKSKEALSEAFLTLKLLGIDIKDYPDHEMFLLNYNMIEAKKGSKIVEECRGLILSYTGEVIRKGFNRFYNLGENGVTDFDFEHSIVYEKADGSLMFVYWCPSTNQWEIGTRGTAFAEGPNDFHGTFRKFMLKAMNKTEEQFQKDCSNLSKSYNYLFEAVGPDNRIVTPYIENHLISLSTMNLLTFEESFSNSIFFKELGWNVKPIKEYSFKSKEQCLIALEELTGLQEGYVAYNYLTGERVKLKNAVYLAAHRLRGNGLTLSAVCELVAMNEQSEYLAVFPEDTSKFTPVEEILASMLQQLKENYDKYSSIENQKEFALKVKDLPLFGTMFQARKYKCDVITAFNALPLNKKIEYLKDRAKEKLGEL